jgi:uncharacterized protein (DUF1919 family)
LQYTLEDEVVRKIINSFFFAIENFRCKRKDFIVISNNCWGSQLYDAMRKQYNTPFVGLFLYPECYIRFLENFESCIQEEIKFTKTSKYIENAPKYPIGLLCDNIEIHFLHYSSEEEAREKWGRRVERLRRDSENNVPIFVKFCDRENCTKDHLERFHALPFKNKISISMHPFDMTNHLYTPRLKDPKGDYVIDGLRLYRKRYHYFDIVNWISTGTCCKTATSKILSLIS